MKRFLTMITITLLALSLSAEDINSILEHYQKNIDLQSLVMEAKLVIKDSLGSSTSEIRSYTRKGGDTRLDVIGGPDKGQKILKKDSALYLYYPDSEEIIRLQGSNLKDSFLGSDFSYEDLTRDNDIQKNYEGTLLDENGYFHVMLKAKNRKQTYQQQELWLDRNTYVPVKTILYSASGKALRQIESSDIRNIDGSSFAMESKVVELLKNNSSTTMTITKIELNTLIKDSIFTKEDLAW
ncbi:MAG: outer membrane lipoprotein-sorting protein [Sphaerochaetaceae bacterium]